MARITKEKEIKVVALSNYEINVDHIFLEFCKRAVVTNWGILELYYPGFLYDIKHESKAER